METLLAGPSPTSPMRRRLPTPLFPTLPFGNRSLQTPLFEASKLPRLLHGAVPYEADQASRGLSTCSRWLYFYIPFDPRPRPSTVGYPFIYRLPSPEALPRLAMLLYTVCPRPRPFHGWLCFYIPFVPARGHPRFPFGSTATLASKAYIHGLI